MLGVDIGFQVDRVALRFGYGSTSKRRMLAAFRSPLDRKSTARLTIDMPSALTRSARGRQTSAYGRSIQSLRSSDIATAISDSRMSRRSSMINRSQPDMLWIGLGFRREQQSVSHSLHRLHRSEWRSRGLFDLPAGKATRTRLDAGGRPRAGLSDVTRAEAPRPGATPRTSARHTTCCAGAVTLLVGPSNLLRTSEYVRC
jgi:hypothetical protein